MARRTYGQYCGLANALDLLGERWTLLVLRELLTGPKRFSDVLDALPGVGTGLLTTRLRQLEDEGLIARRRLRPPAGSVVYELTADGRELEPVLYGLAGWGSARLGPPTEKQAFRPHWAMIAMRGSHDPQAAMGVDQVHEFEIGDELFHATIEDGRVELHDGPGRRPDVRVRSDPHTFARLAHDPGAAQAALADGRLAVEGDREAIRCCLAIFAPARPGDHGAPR
jgi:DNA-binding HxlR family transcriptional regulator